MYSYKINAILLNIKTNQLKLVVDIDWQQIGKISRKYVESKWKYRKMFVETTTFLTHTVDISENTGTEAYSEQLLVWWRRNTVVVYNTRGMPRIDCSNPDVGRLVKLHCYASWGVVRPGNQRPRLSSHCVHNKSSPSSLDHPTHVDSNFAVELFLPFRLFQTAGRRPVEK